MRGECRHCGGDCGYGYSDEEDEEHEYDSDGNTIDSVESFEPVTNPTEDQKNNLLSLQTGRIAAFKAQDTENGNFDITFDLAGKLLYANKLIFTAVSTPMEAMISERWSSKDKPIKVETYTYEEFYQLLLFLYSGICKITADNVARLVDMAEFWDVTVMKNHCDKYLAKMIKEMDLETVDEMMEMTQRYSLSKSTDALKKFICQKMTDIVRFEGFPKFKRPFLDELLSVEKITIRNEQELFLAVCKWGENQVSTKEPSLEGIDFLIAVKAELDEIKSKFDFSKMSIDFVLQSIVTKDFLFSTSDLYKILGECNHYGSDEEKYLKAIFAVAEREALKEQTISVDENFNLQNVVKRELSAVIPTIKFCNMKFEFVKECFAGKEFLLTSKKFYEILAQCERRDEENYFKIMFELAEKEALKEQTSSVDENFNLQDVIIEELAEIIPGVHFKRMKIDFVTQFIVDKKFLFSSKKFHEILADCQRSDEEKYFITIFELAEKEALKEQTTSVDENFNLQNIIKRELTEIIPKVNFKRMKLDFVKQFVVDKAFLFSAKKLYEIIAQCPRSIQDESKLFEMLYQVAEKKVETRTSSAEVIDMPYAIKMELAEFLPKINFHKMDRNYLLDFAAKTGFISREQALSSFYVRVQINSGDKLLVGSFEDVLKIKSNANGGIRRTDSGWTFEVTPRLETKVRFTGLKFDIPRSPSQVQQMRGAAWYLLLEKDGILAVKSQSLVSRTDYLIAELRSTQNFSLALRQKTRLTVSHNNIF